MVYHSDDTTTSSEEDIKYADIYIPVPYDPEIPGVRCVDAEDVENVDVFMVTSLSYDGGEDIELQDLRQGGDLANGGTLDPLLSIDEEPQQTGDVEEVF